MILGNRSVGNPVRLPASDGSFLNFRVMHHGKPGADYDGSFSGGTILMLDHSETPYRCAIANDPAVRSFYSGSAVHRDLNSDYLERLDPELAEMIVEVKIPYCSSAEAFHFPVSSGGAGLKAKVWLPSLMEVTTRAMNGYWSDSEEWSPSAFAAEGAIFDYWKDAAYSRYAEWGLSRTDNDGEGWSTRTPNYGVITDHVGLCFYIRSDGLGIPSTKNLMRMYPCLVLPDETLLDNNYRVVVGGRQAHARIDGVWNRGTAYGKIDGVWQKAAQSCCKIDGVWKK